MQPLSRVSLHPNALFGQTDTMESRPSLAIKVADCIREYAEIETILGITLAFLLNADAKVALAMYSSVENRSAQLRMLEGAAKAKLSQDQSELLAAVLSVSVRPVMRERDKLAHWCWGYALDLPDALLLTAPDEKMAVHLGALNPPSSVEFNWDKVFVVTHDDLTRMLSRFRDAKDDLARFAGSVWPSNTPEQRDQVRQGLCNEPRILEGLRRLRKHRTNNRDSPEQSHQSIASDQ
jgi:hypothetical protein